MKLKLKDIKPNPFKKEINNGKLIEEQVKRIQSNIKELGLMGAFPIVKINNQWHLVSGHHRKEALKRAFGENYEVECVEHKYSKEQLLRGMIIENVSQRGIEYEEITGNLLAIKNWLKISARTPSVQAKRKDIKGVFDAGSTSDIYNWLNKNGEVLSQSTIKKYIRIADDLSPSLKKKVKTVKAGQTQEDMNEEGKISSKIADALTGFKDHIEQEDLAKSLKESKLNGVEQCKNLVIYKEASEEIKEKVRNGKVKFDDIPYEVRSEKAMKTIERRNNETTIIDKIADFNSSLSNLAVYIKNFSKQDIENLTDKQSELLQRNIAISFKKSIIPFVSFIFKSKGKIIFEIEE